MLRGHDAQLLVEAGVIEAERSAEADPQWLFAKIDPVARSAEGKRILRGAKLPDLAEIKDWIDWAKESRSLRRLGVYTATRSGQVVMVPCRYRDRYRSCLYRSFSVLVLKNCPTSTIRLEI